MQLIIQFQYQEKDEITEKCQFHLKKINSHKKLKPFLKELSVIDMPEAKSTNYTYEVKDEKNTWKELKEYLFSPPTATAIAEKLYNSTIIVSQKNNTWDDYIENHNYENKKKRLKR